MLLHPPLQQDAAVAALEQWNMVQQDCLRRIIGEDENGALRISKKNMGQIGSSVGMICSKPL